MTLMLPTLHTVGGKLISDITNYVGKQALTCLPHRPHQMPVALVYLFAQWPFDPHLPTAFVLRAAMLIVTLQVLGR